jgi:hypothetical protein
MNERHNLTHVAAKLGRWGSCPDAFLSPTLGDKTDWQGRAGHARQVVLHILDSR